MKKKTIIIIVFILVITVIMLYPSISKKLTVEKVQTAIASGDYDTAILLIEKKSDNEGMQELLEQAYYQKASAFVDKKAYKEANDILLEHMDYEKSSELYQHVQYCIGLQYYENGEYEKALNSLYSVQDYNDSKNKILEVKYMYANSLLEKEEYVQAYYILMDIQEYEDSKNILLELEKHQDKFYQLAIQKYNNTEYMQALELFEIVRNYKDSKEYIEKIELYQKVQGTWEMKTALGSTSTMTFDKFTLTHTFMGGDVNKQNTYDLSFEKYGNKWSLTYKETNYGISIQEWYCISNDKLFRYQKEKKDITSDDVILSYVKVSEDTNVHSLREPQLGMTADEVKRSTWASPSDINTTTTTKHVYEQWCYPGYKYIYLEDNIVVSIQE